SIFITNCFLKMTAPNIATSTKEERLAFVKNEWKCQHNCEICGRCHVLKNRSEEEVFADYVEGKRTYLEIVLEMRK
ncbi:MAG: hypothetical protein PUB84_05955, partial [Bacteroidales bacterium]|nr:hypothetical protein [Bacteroidales bacterium]